MNKKYKPLAVFNQLSKVNGLSRLNRKKHINPYTQNFITLVSNLEIFYLRLKFLMKILTHVLIALPHRL